jgi:hypothetical protein
LISHEAAQSINIAQQAFGAVDGSANGGVGAKANCLECRAC